MFVNDKETFKRIAFIACHVIKTNDYKIPPNLTVTKSLKLFYQIIFLKKEIKLKKKH